MPHVCILHFASCIPSGTLVHALAQLFEVQHDRFIRSQQVGKDFVPRADVARPLLFAAEERPQTLTQVLRQYAFGG